MSEHTELTPEELKEAQDFLKEKQLDIQIQIIPQKVRRMEDGGIVIDAPTFNTKMIKLPDNGENGIDST